MTGTKWIIIQFSSHLSFRLSSLIPLFPTCWFSLWLSFLFQSPKFSQYRHCPSFTRTSIFLYQLIHAAFKIYQEFSYSLTCSPYKLIFWVPKSANITHVLGTYILYQCWGKWNSKRLKDSSNMLFPLPQSSTTLLHQLISQNTAQVFLYSKNKNVMAASILS